MKKFFALLALCSVVAIAVLADEPVRPVAKSTTKVHTDIAPVKLTAAQTETALDALAPTIQFPTVDGAKEITAVVRVKLNTNGSIAESIIFFQVK